MKKPDFGSNLPGKKTAQQRDPFSQVLSIEGEERPQRKDEAHVAQHAAGHGVRKAHLGLRPNWV